MFPKDELEKKKKYRKRLLSLAAAEENSVETAVAAALFGNRCHFHIEIMPLKALLGGQRVFALLPAGVGMSVS